MMSVKHEGDIAQPAIKTVEMPRTPKVLRNKCGYDHLQWQPPHIHDTTSRTFLVHRATMAGWLSAKFNHSLPRFKQQEDVQDVHDTAIQAWSSSVHSPSNDLLHQSLALLSSSTPYNDLKADIIVNFTVTPSTSLPPVHATNQPWPSEIPGRSAGWLLPPNSLTTACVCTGIFFCPMWTQLHTYSVHQTLALCVRAQGGEATCSGSIFNNGVSDTEDKKITSAECKGEHNPTSDQHWWCTGATQAFLK